MVVERVCGMAEIVAELRQSRRTGIPVRDAVGWRMVDIVVTRRARCIQQHRIDGVATANLVQLGIRARGDPLELLGTSEHDPGKTARPGSKRGVALLRAGAAIATVVNIEDALVRNSAPCVVSISAVTVV